MQDSTSSDESNKTKAAPVLAYQSSPVASMSAVIWCRILAIFMLGWGLQSFLSGLIGSIDYLQRSGVRAPLLTIVLSLLVPGPVWLLLAWYCWAKAPSLADRMTRERGENRAPSGMSADELLLTLIIGIGLYMLVVGFGTFAELVYIYSLQMRYAVRSNTTQGGIIVGSGVRCTLGFWFILGPREILNTVRRYGGK